MASWTSVFTWAARLAGSRIIARVHSVFSTEATNGMSATFLARALRMAHKLPVGSGELHFTPQELQETLKDIET